MSIQITNDPLNQFLDNLPRYALELRRQDKQRNQFERQMALREKAAKNQQTLFDLTRDRQKFESDLFKNQYEFQKEYRDKRKEWQDYRKKYSRSYDSYQRAAEGSNAFFGLGNLIAPKSYEQHIERMAKVTRGGDKIRAEQALKEYRELPALDKIRPKELTIPQNIEFNKTLFGLASANLQPTIDNDINRLFQTFGGSQMGRPIDSFLSYQNIESRSAR